MPLRIAWLVCASVLASAGSARGQPDPPTVAALDPDEESARRHFERGMARYLATDYASAIVEFERARELRPLAAFTYNIARCHDRMERFDRALAEYTRYAATAPPGEVSGEVLARIAVLRARLEPRRPRAPYLIPGVLLGSALLVGGIGAGLTGHALTEYPSARAAYLGDGSPSHRSAGLALEKEAIAGYALLGVAGAAAAVDVVLWALAARAARRR